MLKDTIDSLFVTFLTGVEAAVDSAVRDKLLAAAGEPVLGASAAPSPAAPVKRGPGRPRKTVVANGNSVSAAAAAAEPAEEAPARKKRKVVKCPYPRCRNPAAPIFGMVCKKHKDVDKDEIKGYREARKNGTPVGEGSNEDEDDDDDDNDAE